MTTKQGEPEEEAREDVSREDSPLAVLVDNEPTALINDASADAKEDGDKKKRDLDTEQEEKDSERPSFKKSRLKEEVKDEPVDGEEGQAGDAEMENADCTSEISDEPSNKEKGTIDSQAVEKQSDPDAPGMEISQPESEGENAVRDDDAMKGVKESESAEMEKPLSDLTATNLNDTPTEDLQQAEADGSNAAQTFNNKDPVVASKTPPLANDAFKQENKKRSKKNKHKDPRMLDIRRRIQLSCRDNDLETAIKAYEEAIADNIELEAQSYYNLLNLCDGLGKSILHVGTPKARSPKNSNASSPTPPESEGGSTTFAKKLSEEKFQKEEVGTEKKSAALPVVFMDLKKRLEYALRIKDRMSQQNLPLNEAAYSAIIKLLSKNKEYEKAEKMLSEADSVQQCIPKLRLYASLMTAYCEASQMLNALQIWKRMKRNEGLELTERELLALMRCATVTGDSLVMEFVLTELAEEVPVPCKDTVAAILEWFGSTHSQHEESLTDRLADTTAVKQVLDFIAKSDSSERPPCMGPVVSTNGWQISSACHIEDETGKLVEGCLVGCFLNPVPLSARAVNEMMKMNEAIVFDGKVAGNTCQFQGGRKGKKRNDFSPESRRHDWSNFIRFLERQEKQADSKCPFDIVIDGANIGYHQQNFSDAPRHVDYNQIDWTIRHFQEVKKQKVLLVMHSRHFSNKMLPDKYRPLYNAWMKGGILYKTPFGMNDDWFWMHAALKYNLLVVTNDEMRDHHFQMLAPRSFLRWKERQQIRFGFGNWEEGTGENRGRKRQVILEYPSVYSRRIQKVQDGLVVPLAKRGDENRFLDGSHYASDDEPKEETYLCIRPKAPATKVDANEERSR